MAEIQFYLKKQVYDQSNATRGQRNSDYYPEKGSHTASHAPVQDQGLNLVGPCLAARPPDREKRLQPPHKCAPNATRRAATDGWRGQRVPRQK